MATPADTPRRTTTLRASALLILAGLVVLDWWVFRLAGRSYWEFWLNAGPVIGLATAAFGWAWGGLDRNPGLVAFDPLDYVGAVAQVAGLPLDAFGGHLNHDNHERRVPLTDTLLVIPLALVFLAAVAGWMLVIAPGLYFAFLVFGAPSRIALASRFRVYARLDGSRLHYRGGTALDPAAHRQEDGWWDASMRDRPVTVASAFMAASLLIIDIVLG